jgi:hypothetical protein
MSSFCSPALRRNLLITDVGFVAYWLVTLFGLLPSAWLFRDYHDPVMVSWNWSFLPVDLLASCFGLAAVYASARGIESWRRYALVSVTLTFCAGAMAISFWALRCDFDPAWWLPNLYLCIWPIFMSRFLFRNGKD